MRTRSSKKRFLKRLYLAVRNMALLPLSVFAQKEAFPADSEVSTIAVLRFDRIGDMVLTTPLFEGLKKRFPTSRLIVVASERNQDVIRHDPSVDEIVVFRGYSLTGHILRQAGVDLAIDPFYTYEIRQARLTGLCGARYRLGFRCAGRELFFNLRGPGITGEPAHMSTHLTRLAATLGIVIDRYEPRVYVSDEEREWARQYLRQSGIGEGARAVAVHPGSFYPSQRWSMEGFAKIGAFLADRHHAHVFLFGDRSEETLLRLIHDRIDRERVTVFCDMNLRHVIAMLGQCSLLVGNNSGLLHLAGALGVPTVSIVGPTDFVLWQPCGRGHIVIRHPVPCSPCSRPVCADHWCMKAISAGDVERAINQQMEKMTSQGGRPT